MKPKAPVRPAPLAGSTQSAAIQRAMRESPKIGAALARLRPADRAYASNAIAAAIAARLTRKGMPE